MLLEATPISGALLCISLEKDSYFPNKRTTLLGHKPFRSCSKGRPLTETTIRDSRFHSEILVCVRIYYNLFFILLPTHNKQPLPPHRPRRSRSFLALLASLWSVRAWYLPAPHLRPSNPTSMIPKYRQGSIPFLHPLTSLPRPLNTQSLCSDHPKGPHVRTPLTPLREQSLFLLNQQKGDLSVSILEKGIARFVMVRKIGVPGHGNPSNAEAHLIQKYAEKGLMLFLFRPVHSRPGRMDTPSDHPFFQQECKAALSKTSEKCYPYYANQIPKGLIRIIGTCSDIFEEAAAGRYSSITLFRLLSASLHPSHSYSSELCFVSSSCKAPASPGLSRGHGHVSGLPDTSVSPNPFPLIYRVTSAGNPGLL